MENSTSPAPDSLQPMGTPSDPSIPLWKKLPIAIVKFSLACGLTIFTTWLIFIFTVRFQNPFHFALKVTLSIFIAAIIFQLLVKELKESSEWLKVFQTIAFVFFFSFFLRNEILQFVNENIIVKRDVRLNLDLKSTYYDEKGDDFDSLLQDFSLVVYAGNEKIDTFKNVSRGDTLLTWEDVGYSVKKASYFILKKCQQDSSVWVRSDFQLKDYSSPIDDFENVMNVGGSYLEVNKDSIRNSLSKF